MKYTSGGFSIMLKLFTAIYLLCSLYSANLDISQTAFTQNFVDGMLQDGILILSEEPESEPDTADLQSPEKDIKDYISELKKLNYYKEDGKDGKLNARNAILRFQSDHNLVVNGVWDDKCAAALKKRLSDKSFRHTDKVANPPADGKWIVINKSKRILTHYEDSIVEKKYPIAVGNPPSLTPSGKYKIVNKVVDPTWGGGGYAKPIAGGSPSNPLGHRWMGLSIGNGNSYGIHGNNKPYSIGTNASHGCIRMINSDVEEFFKIVPISAGVWIGTASELTEWGITQDAY
jgi:lipoprotein-anchoring transpeptidase ErfK/SrfK